MTSTKTKSRKTTKTLVPQRLVDRMVRHYGTIEAARDAYRQLKAAMGAYEVLWVTTSGEIACDESGDILYNGSPEAYDVLPS